METYSEYKNKAGVYKLTCKNNGKMYIGKSVNIMRRLNDHRRSKENGYFQRAVLKHGWASFKVDILETFENFDKVKDNQSLLNRESYYINLFDTTDRTLGYNRCKYSSDTTGIPFSDEHREKLRKASIGKKRPPRTDEHRENLSIALSGRVFSEETKEKMRKAQSGKKRSPHSKERIEKIRQKNIGRKHSDETKEKLRQANLGKKHSEETKEKVSRANLGKTLSEEHKEKLRMLKLGTTHSEETKEKIRKAKQRNKTVNYVINI